MQTELKKRILSAAVLAPLALGIIYIGGIPFMLLMLACFILMMREWLTITKPSPKRWLWAVWGVIYIGMPCWVLAGSTQLLLFYVIAVVWSTDIGAYFAGRNFGKHKIAPSISPHKSWEGLIGGALLSLMVVYVFLTYILSTPVSRFSISIIGPWYIITPMLTVIAQIGDFYESWIKRKFGVKDSGNLIPGHGGLLDRMDGVLSATWAFSFYLLWCFSDK